MVNFLIVFAAWWHVVLLVQKLQSEATIKGSIRSRCQIVGYLHRQERVKQVSVGALVVNRYRHGVFWRWRYSDAPCMEHFPYTFLPTCVFNVWYILVYEYPIHKPKEHKSFGSDDWSQGKMVSTQLYNDTVKNHSQRSRRDIPLAIPSTFVSLYVREKSVYNVHATCKYDIFIYVHIWAILNWFNE